VIADAGAISNFLHYGARGSDPGFPATICASVNDEVVHGIPRATTILREGDLLSIDAGCILDGWHADSAVSVHVGEPPSMDEVDLIAACDRAMWAGIAVASNGGRLGDISFAIENSVQRSGRDDGRRYGSVEGYGWHGIGTAMHMPPFVGTRASVERVRDWRPGRAGPRADDHPRPSGNPATVRRLDSGHQGRRPGRAHRAFHRHRRGRHLCADGR
jgi:methionyl aminopeptidase